MRLADCAGTRRALGLPLALLLGACTEWGAPMSSEELDATGRNESALMATQAGGQRNVWTQTTIPTCFLDDAWNTWSSATRADVEDAMKSTWGLYTKLKFTGFGHCNGSESNTLMFDHWSENGGQSFPWGPAGAINGNVIVKMNGPAGPIWNTAVHEVGHALGFPHEQDGSQNFDGNGDPVYCLLLNVWDPNNQSEYLWDFRAAASETGPLYDTFSVMNYCGHSYNAWNGEQLGYTDPNGLSFGDLKGGQYAYGVSATGTWMDASAAITSLL